MNPYPDDFNGDAFDRSQGTEDREFDAQAEENERAADFATAAKHAQILHRAIVALTQLEYIGECPVLGYSLSDIIIHMNHMLPDVGRIK